MTDQSVDVIDNQYFEKRPTFLTVLCIMTFVVSGYNLLMSVIGLFGENALDSNQMESGMAQLREAMNEADPNTRDFLVQVMDAMRDMVQTGMEYATTLGIGEIISAGLSLLGAILMFNLRKSGYYTYIAAKIIGVAVPFAIFGFNLLTTILYGFAALISVVFIILYGINRKALH